MRCRFDTFFQRYRNVLGPNCLFQRVSKCLGAELSFSTGAELSWCRTFLFPYLFYSVMFELHMIAFLVCWSSGFLEPLVGRFCLSCWIFCTCFTSKEKSVCDVVSVVLLFTDVVPLFIEPSMLFSRCCSCISICFRTKFVTLSCIAFIISDPFCFLMIALNIVSFVHESDD